MKYTTQPSPQIVGLTAFSLQDFPDRASCILWFQGCNFRCKYCHNPELVLGPVASVVSISEIHDFLQSRQNLLDGVVLSGGECTMYKHLLEFVQYIRNMGFQVKLDTNGSNPKMIQQMLDLGLLDYVALDYKAPKHKFQNVTQCSESLWEDFSLTLNILLKSDVKFEIRTTFHESLMDENDINEIILDLENRSFSYMYYIQKCQNLKTLANLPEMPNEVDRTKLTTPKNFAVHFRNF
jgi:pyruvate formate lyase activating enzyme